MKKHPSLEDFSFEEKKKFLSKEEESFFQSLSESKKIEKLLVQKGIYKILSKVLNSEVHNYKLKKEPSGKPYLEKTDSNSTYFISYSHSKKTVALAITKDFDLGLDVENINRFKNHRAFNKWLHKDEEKYLSFEHDKLENLTMIWTRKESLAKLTGLGYKFVFKNYKIFPEEEFKFNQKKVKFFSLKEKDEIMSLAYYKSINNPEMIKID